MRCKQAFRTAVFADETHVKDTAALKFQITCGPDSDWGSPANSQAWGYLKEDAGKAEFSVLTNGRGSCKCRQYDAKTGVRLDPKLPSVPGDYTHVYAALISKWTKLPTPPRSLISDLEDGLPYSILSDLQRNAQLPITKEKQCAVTLPGRTSILNGLDKLINDALQLQQLNYETSKDAAFLRSKHPVDFDASKLIDALYAQVLRNWDGCMGRSTKLWRWQAMDYISPENTSLEKTLEKAIVDLNVEWVNQIPVASGLLRRREERHVCIDLGHKSGRTAYELIELKIGPSAKTPLSAAFQILKYGMLYFFARNNAHRLNVPAKSGVLAAERIDLKVLAPIDCYQGLSFCWLSRLLNEGLAKFCQEHFGRELLVTFCFESFPSDFRWPGATPKELNRYLSNRSCWNK